MERATFERKILWLGSFCSEEMIKESREMNMGLASGYASEKSIIKGIDLNLPSDVIMDSINALTYRPYPRGHTLFVNRKEWHRNNSSTDISVNYINFIYYNMISKYIRMKSCAKQWLINQSAKPESVIVFCPGLFKIKTALFLKRVCNAKVYIIIPDIPEYVNMRAGKLNRWLKSINAKLLKKSFASVDGFILYSDKMANYYNLSEEKWIRMEGSFDLDELQYTDIDPISKKRGHILMYSGALNIARGIPQLLDAFNLIKDQDYELWLTGEGDALDLIEERSQNDSRIKYFGFLKNREEVLELQSKADVLIHTRDEREPSSQYCFPSKLFEYLISGKPVLSVKLGGIPDEYYKYMFPIDSLAPNDILKSIYSVFALNDEEIRTRVEAAKNFIISEKNSKVQAAKILRFMKIV